MDAMSSHEPRFVPVAEVSDFRRRPVRRVRAGALAICVARSDGRFFAFEDACPHMRTPLSDGLLRDGVLRCGMHNWQFELESGRCVAGGRDWACLKLYPVKVESGRVWVAVPPEADPREEE